MSEYHFIVKFDSKTTEWSWDVDTEQTKFDDGTIWDADAQEWRFDYKGDGEYDAVAETINDYFPQAIELLNNLKYLVPQKA